MKFAALISSLVILGFSTSASADSLSYDEAYDSASGSLSDTSCSDGSNGLAKQYPTYGDLPKFPYIGGASAINSWNSPNCGTCWKLTYTNDKGVANSVNILAVDVAQDGFNVAVAAMDSLTGGLAKELGRIDVTSEQVDASVCGL